VNVNTASYRVMSFLLDEGQQAIATESRRIVDARADPATALRLLEEHGHYDVNWWAMACEQGWPAIAIAEDNGGLGLGLIELGQVAQAIGSAGAGAPFLTGGFGVANAIARHGDTATKAVWLDRIARGDAIGAVAFGEGQSPLPPAPTVTFADGKLNGTKPAVSGGLHAEVAVVYAIEYDGPVLAIADLSGAQRTPISGFDNSRCTADLVFDGVDAIRLNADDAHAAALAILARQAIVTAHEQVGGAEAMMLRARDYAVTRKAFGQPIGAFQSVKHRIAELYGLVEIARANALHAAANADGPDLVKHAAAARLSATEAYDTAARDCVQVHGGIGVTWEAGIHLHLRRTRTLAIELGNMLFWEDVLVDRLAGDDL
jgi:acyl-CoA dehydrogenase